MRKFMKHQKDAFEYAKPLARIALFMDMRLGKTMVAIRWVDFNKLKKGLVICPKDILIDWEEELQKEYWADEEIRILKGTTQERLQEAKESNTVWNLTNFTTINYVPEILCLPWDFIIIDESTAIKNPKTKLTKLVNSLCTRINYRAILTGLPNPESELDYFEQMKFLYGNFMNETVYWHWRRKNFYEVANHDWIPNKYSKEKIKKAVADRAFVLTAEEAGIGNKKIYEKRYVELNAAQLKAYIELDNLFEYEDTEGEYQTTKQIPVKLGWMHKICGGFDNTGTILSDAKYQLILYLLKGDLKGKSLVIWFKHTRELRYAKAFFEDKGFKCAFLKSQEAEGEEEFKQGKRQIMLAQAKCGRYGKDWSIASVAIYYSNWWSGETRAQSEKRIEHPNKKHPLLYIDLICVDSVDIDIFRALKSKAKTSKKFLEEVIKNWRKRHALRNS